MEREKSDALLDYYIKELHGRTIMWFGERYSGIPRPALKCIILIDREHGVSVKPLDAPKVVLAKLKEAWPSTDKTIEEVSNPKFCVVGRLTSFQQKPFNEQDEEVLSTALYKGYWTYEPRQHTSKPICNF